MKRLINTVVLLFFCSLIATAQPGTLDKNFGDSGIIISNNYYGNCEDILIQPDNKIIAVGTGSFGTSYGFLLVRYLLDGTPDLNFGDSGRVATTVLGKESRGQFGALQSDGKIVVCGMIVVGGTDIALVRYNSNGTIDSSFGINGVTKKGIDKYENPAGMVIQADGKIVVGGVTGVDISGGDNIIYFIRFNADGTIDESFADKGVYKENPSEPVEGGGIALQPDGKIIIGGDYRFTKDHSFFIKRLLPDGTLDKEFGINGEALGSFENSSGSVLHTVQTNNDGKIIAAGAVYIGNNNSKSVLMEFNYDGSLDSKFGSMGTSIHEFGGSSYIDDIAIQTDGKIAATGPFGDMFTFQNTKFSVSRFTVDGKADSLFGDNGIQITDVGDAPLDDAIALQKDGKIIIGGYSLVGIPPFNYQHLTLARYFGGEDKNDKYVKIKHWLHHHGITWQDKPDNISYYSVQRSSNGNAFKEVSRIFSNKKGAVQTYTTEDNATATYRVAAVSSSGNISYSNTLTLTAEDGFSIKLYPNPVKSSLRIEGLPANAKTKITITDISGSIKIITTVNSSVYSLNVSQLTRGSYIIKAESENNVVTKPFIKE